MDDIYDHLNDDCAVVLLLRDGGRMVLLVPPSVNNGAYFRRIRRRMLELGRIEDITIIRQSHIFGDAMTAVEIVTMTRTEDGFKKNVRASDAWLWDVNGDGSDFVLTDDKTWLSSFCAGKTTISQRGFTVRTGSIVWNQHKAEFSDAGGDSMFRCVFARDIATDGTLVSYPEAEDFGASCFFGCAWVLKNCPGLTEASAGRDLRSTGLF